MGDQSILTPGRRIFQFALVVGDYDEAIRWYCDRLDFVLLEDTSLSETKRWVRVAPHEQSEMSILLAKAATPKQSESIGNQTGGRVFLFMHTDDLDRDHRQLLDANVKIVREPVVEEWGKVLVFADLYGNLWDLIEPPRY